MQAEENQMDIGKKTKKHFISRPSEKMRMAVHYNSWFIAMAWKDSRKKWWEEIIAHACEIGNKYYLKGLLTQITVHSKLGPHLPMMRPFLETRCRTSQFIFFPFF